MEKQRATAHTKQQPCLGVGGEARDARGRAVPRHGGGRQHQRPVMGQSARGQCVPHRRPPGQGFPRDVLGRDERAAPQHDAVHRGRLAGAHQGGVPNFQGGCCHRHRRRQVGAGVAGQQAHRRRRRGRRSQKSAEVARGGARQAGLQGVGRAKEDEQQGALEGAEEEGGAVVCEAWWGPELARCQPPP